MCKLAVGLLLCSQIVMAADERPFIAVFVIDGLRADIISQTATPNLYRLKTEGTWAAHSHSVFPTVTRVNSSSISTGTVPSVHGIVSNTMYVEGVDSKPFDTANYLNLLKLASISNGRTLAVPTLAETLEAAGLHYAAVGSGSTGATFLLNPMAPKGVGVSISGSYEDGKRVAWPDKVDAEIRARFGSQLADVGLPSLLWTERVVRDYVVPELRPRVLIDWLTEPDTTQHRTGVGSAESMAVIRTADEQVGLFLAKLNELGIAEKTDVIVTADHGFAVEPEPVNFTGALQASGKASDVIVASNGASLLIYAKNHDAGTISAVVAQLQKTEGVDLLFTTARQPRARAVECEPGAESGWVPGTFSLELVNQCRAERGADIFVTFKWNSEVTNGFPGKQWTATNDKREHVAGRAGHGGLNPYMVHTPLIFWGPDFRKNAVVEAPTANYDIAPTILKLEGVAAPASMSGRVVAEAFAKSPAPDRKAKTRMITVKSGAYCASIQVSELSQRQYVDEGQRCR